MIENNRFSSLGDKIIPLLEDQIKTSHSLGRGDHKAIKSANNFATFALIVEFMRQAKRMISDKEECNNVLVFLSGHKKNQKKQIMQEDLSLLQKNFYWLSVSLLITNPFDEYLEDTALERGLQELEPLFERYQIGLYQETLHALRKAEKTMPTNSLVDPRYTDKPSLRVM